MTTTASLSNDYLTLSNDYLMLSNGRMCTLSGAVPSELSGVNRLYV